MVVRVTTGRAILAATLGLGLAAAVQAADNPDIGPLPQLETDKARPCMRSCANLAPPVSRDLPSTTTRQAS